MIKLKVVSYNGLPPEQPIHCEFSELGGSIGRADGNTLVLPDPDRYVSRTHAAIVCRDGGYLIRDVSSASPVEVNGRPLGNGKEARLLGGEEIRIGGYTLEVLADMPTLLNVPGSPPAQAEASRDVPKKGPMAMFDRLGGNPFKRAFAPAADKQTAQNPELGDTTRKKPHGKPDAVAAGPAPLPRQAASSGPATVADAGLPVNASRAGDLIDPAPAPQPLRARDTVDATMPLAKPMTAPDAGSMLVSWDEAESAPVVGEIKTVIIPSPRQAAAAPQADPSASSAPAVVEAAGNAVDSQPASQQAPQPMANRQGGSAGEELLRAFLEGAGVPDLAMQEPLTVQTMNMIGQLLRASTQGTLDLLQARALIRRELHADVTVIAANENNPLKFSPNVEVALAHLLAPRGKGFMKPVTAMKDAFKDLRADQAGFMAGMQAALAGVLRQFDPEQLEARLTEKSLVDAMLPTKRKARLWTLFMELYADISREAQADFHSLLGEEFLRAYQAQLDESEKSGPDAPQSEQR